MSKKAMMQEIRAKMKEREYMATLFPPWMERTHFYIAGLQQRDKMTIKAIKLGVTKNAV